MHYIHIDLDLAALNMDILFKDCIWWHWLYLFCVYCNCTFESYFLRETCLQKEFILRIVVYNYWIDILSTLNQYTRKDNKLYFALQFSMQHWTFFKDCIWYKLLNLLCLLHICCITKVISWRNYLLKEFSIKDVNSKLLNWHFIYSKQVYITRKDWPSILNSILLYLAALNLNMVIL